MKCHLVLVYSTLCLFQALSSQASADLPDLKNEELIAEHRSAKPEPFLDRLASFFSGGSSTANNQNKKIHHQLTSASVQRPVAVKPPLPPRPPSLPRPNIPLRKTGPSRPQPVYNGQSAAPSNNFQTFVKPPGKTINNLKKNMSTWIRYHNNIHDIGLYFLMSVRLFSLG